MSEQNQANLTQATGWRPTAALKQPRKTNPRRTAPLVSLLAIIAASIYPFMRLWKDPEMRSAHKAVILAAGVLLLFVLIRFTGAIVRQSPKDPDKESQLRL